jgi:hypothetical protein
LGDEIIEIAPPKTVTEVYEVMKNRFNAISIENNLGVVFPPMDEIDVAVLEKSVGLKLTQAAITSVVQRAIYSVEKPQELSDSKLLNDMLDKGICVLNESKLARERHEFHGRHKPGNGKVRANDLAEAVEVVSQPSRS